MQNITEMIFLFLDRLRLKVLLTFHINVEELNFYPLILSINPIVVLNDKYKVHSFVYNILELLMYLYCGHHEKQL